MPRPSATADQIAALLARQAAILDAANDTDGRATLEAKLDATRRACRSALVALRSRTDREAVLAHRDLVPESTTRALARLRRQLADGGNFRTARDAGRDR